MENHNIIDIQTGLHELTFLFNFLKALFYLKRKTNPKMKVHKRRKVQRQLGLNTNCEMQNRPAICRSQDGYSGDLPGSASQLNAF